jgi:hypothetical protein
MDLWVREVILSMEPEDSLCHPDGHDLLVELGEARVQVNGIAGDQAAKLGGYQRNSYG